MTVAAHRQDHGALMDAVYRHQRHIYDATRKYYLFGRDAMMRGLAVPPGGSVLEVGCGTGRNLALVRRLWPDAVLYGVDISVEMLKSAHARAGLNAVLAVGDAAMFDAGHLLGRDRFDRILMPYCTSMIPAWREALVNACSLLSTTGSLHIVDFGPMDRMPTILRSALRAWLRRFHVVPRDELAAFAAEIAAPRGLACTITNGAGGYYQSVVLTRIGAV